MVESETCYFHLFTVSSSGSLCWCLSLSLRAGRLSLTQTTHPAAAAVRHRHPSAHVEQHVLLVQKIQGMRASGNVRLPSSPHRDKFVFILQTDILSYDEAYPMSFLIGRFIFKSIVLSAGPMCLTHYFTLVSCQTELININVWQSSFGILIGSRPTGTPEDQSIFDLFQRGR